MEKKKKKASKKETQLISILVWELQTKTISQLDGLRSIPKTEAEGDKPSLAGPCYEVPPVKMVVLPPLSTVSADSLR
jgi:hypothetical protein